MKRDSNWPHEEFGQHEMLSHWWVMLLLFGALAAVFLPSLRIAARQDQVVVYCAQDEVFADPIFREFEKETGIKVRAVYDSEAVKTVGLANRLLAERNHPQCDVFWGNEEMRARQLAERHVFRPTNGWAEFGFRSRRLVVNTKLVPDASAPRSLLELTNEQWRGKVALAYPQFGTTAAQFHALRQMWGPAAWEAWCRALAANRPHIVDGNSFVVRVVGSGEASIGLTDSDDIAAGQREGLPVAALPITSETLLIPNTVGLVQAGPHPRAAQVLFEFLQRPQIAQRLVDARALESAASRPAGRTMKVDWNTLLKDLEPVTAILNRIFLR